VVVAEPDAPGVHECRSADSTHELEVGVAAGGQVGFHGPEQLAELVVGRGREEERLVRARRGVERQEPSLVPEIDLHRERPGSDLDRVRVGEETARPGAHGELRVGDLLRRSFGRARIEDERVRVPEDDRPCALAHQ
jgi:hypothetical protein